MSVVYKYPAHPGVHPDKPDSRLFHVALQGGVPTLWASVEPGAVSFEIVITGTGHPVPPHLVGCGSFQLDGFVWHVWADLR